MHELTNNCLKIKNIESDGFDITQIGCIDLAFAVATSYYDEKSYFMYGLFCSLYKNWGHEELSFKNVTEKVGYEIVEHTCGDFDSLLSMIKSNIDLERPIVILLHYNELFYNENYKEDINLYHGIPVTGYNLTKGTVRFKELSSCFFEEDQGRGRLIADITLSTSILEEIWGKSNLRFNGEEDHFRHKLYALHKRNNEFNDLYSLFLKEVDSAFGQNKLIDLINQFNSNKSEINNIDGYIKWARKNFLGPIVAIFTAIERLHFHLTGSCEISDEIKKAKDESINNRHVILSRLQLCLIKLKDLDEKFIKERTELLKRDDITLKKLFASCQNL